MDIEEIPPRLPQFLDWMNKEECLYKFLVGCGKGTASYKFEWLNNTPHEWINQAMEWSATDEGHSFWADKHEDWKRWLRDNPPDIDWQNELDSFLVENHCYTEYYRNVEEGDNVSENPFIREVEDLLDCTFDWDADDGIDWDDINSKWQRHIEALSQRLKENITRVEVEITIPDDYAWSTPVTKGTSTAAIPEPFFPGNVAYR